MTATGTHESFAIISPDGMYRYRLGRRWDDGSILTWVMLNPSTADAELDDNTIRRCIGFAKRWRYGAIDVVNLYALRATNPRELWEHPAPMGPDNLRHVNDALRNASGPTIAAWGGMNRRPGIPTRVAVAQRSEKWADVFCLGKTADGSPRHPLYVPSHMTLTRWP